MGGQIDHLGTFLMTASDFFWHHINCAFSLVDAPFLRMCVTFQRIACSEIGRLDVLPFGIFGNRVLEHGAFNV
jgi:hypothetical protein